VDDEKLLYWVGSALDDLRVLPAEVKDVFGFALHLAQWGDRHPDAEDFDGDTFRAVYTVRFREAVFVLHVFQKKSRRGVKTPKPDMDLVKQRLKLAEAWYHKLANDDD
jgi:phage-related protein